MNEDGTLKPNQEYTTGENGYTYKTDSNGNIVSAHADELKFKTHDGRLKHNPNTADKLSGDDAGHIFADQFGGSPELDNLVSQRSTLNRAVKGDNKTYRAMEKSWSDAMNNGKKVTDVGIKLSYKDGSSRPSSFKVSSGTFSGNLQMRIFAKRGTHALDLSELSHYSGEKEILFGAGQQFTITNANIQNGVLYIDVIAK